MQTNENTNAAPAAVEPRDVGTAGAHPVQDRSRLHRRLTVNSLSNLARYIVSVGLGFFLTPFIVRTLGDSLYGFWVVLLSFVGYASILEMGIQPAVVKLVGQYQAVENHAKLRELITAAFLFFAAVSVVSGVAILCFLPGYFGRHVADVGTIPHAPFVFAAIAFDVLLMFMNYLFAGILYGWQRYHAKNLIDMATWVINAALLLALLQHHGLLALAASKLATDAASLAGTIVVCLRTFPELRPRSVSKRSFAELIGFGSRVFISATTTRIANSAQPIIISTWLSAAATAFYSIPFRLVDYARQTSWALTTGFMPLFSELHSRREGAMLRTLYLNYSRYVLLLTLPIFVVILVWGEPFIRLWIGPDYAERGRWVLVLLTASAVMEGLQPLLWRLFLGIGQLNVLVTVSAVGSCIVVGGGILLVRPLGIAGVALAVFAGSALSQLAFAVYSCAFLGTNPSGLFARVHLRSLIVGAASYGAGRLLAANLGVGSYATITLGATIAVLAYSALAILVAVSQEERQWVIARAVKTWRRPLGSA